MRTVTGRLSRHALSLLFAMGSTAAGEHARSQPLTTPLPNSPVTGDTPTVSTPTVKSVPQLASRYGVSVDEWDSYQRVMGDGPALWPRSMHPLLVLGFEATSDLERRRYAERYADHEFARLQKADAFTVVWEQVWQARYGDLIQRLRPSRKPTPAFSATERAALFAEPDCAACDARLQQLLFRLDAGEIAGLDVYLLGVRDDDAIRHWARQRAVSPQAVKDGQVTLNHDAGLLSELADDPTPPLPVVLRDTGANGLDALRAVAQ